MDLMGRHELTWCQWMNGRHSAFNSFRPLAQQVEFLEKRRHVYVLPEGCLNVSAINGHNLDYVAESIHLALTTQP